MATETVECIVVGTQYHRRDSEDDLEVYGHGETVTVSRKDFKRLSEGVRPVLASKEVALQAAKDRAAALALQAQQAADALQAQIDAANGDADDPDATSATSAEVAASGATENPIGGGTHNPQAAPKPDSDEDGSDGSDDTAGDPPPKSGPGSEEAAWREYARKSHDPDYATATLAELKKRHG